MLRAHEEQFQTLITMLGSDAEADPIFSRRYVLKSDRPYRARDPYGLLHNGLSEERWNRYQVLFQEVGLNGAAGDGARVSFQVDGPSYTNGDSDKGLIFSEDPLTPVMRDLDSVRVSEMGRDKNDDYIAYNLKPDWYIYLHYNH